MVVYDLSRIGISGETINTEVGISYRNMSAYITNIDGTVKVLDDIFVINDIRYEYIGHLASGNYGDVYKVKNTTDNKIYALKRQKVEYDSVNLLLNRAFKREAIQEAIVNLILYDTQGLGINGNKYIGDVHKIVCRKFLTGESIDYIRIYTIIEFFEANTLYGYLSERSTDRNMFLEQSVSPVKKIAEILKELQGSLQFTHGDFHGRNSMITNDGNIKIIDFGFTQIKKDNLTIIGSREYNKHYNPGKDLTILLNSIFGHSIISADAEYDKTGPVYNMYKDIIEDYIFTNDSKNTLRDTINLYEYVDQNDNPKGHPTNVITKIDELPESVGSTTLALRRSPRIASRKRGGGSRNKTCKLKGGRASTAKLNSLSVERIKSIGKEKERIKSIGKEKPVHYLEEPPLPAEYILNKKRDDMSKEAIIRIFEASPVPHIKKYAKLIADTYMEEKHKSLQLNLLCTLLYFNSSIQEGAFEFYCESYKNSNKTQRKFMVNTIHFNVIKDCIKFIE